MIFHKHICKFDLGCVEVLSRDQKLRRATAPFLASLCDYIANLLREVGVQNWELGLLIFGRGKVEGLCVGERNIRLFENGTRTIRTSSLKMSSAPSRSRRSCGDALCPIHSTWSSSLSAVSESGFQFIYPLASSAESTDLLNRSHLLA